MQTSEDFLPDPTRRPTPITPLVRFLQRAGVLQALYTDFAVSEGSIEHLLVRAGVAAYPKAQNLSRRVIPGLPRSALRRLPPGALLAKKRAPDEAERWAFRESDLREADVIYSQYFAGGMLQHEELVSHGARFVSDVFIMPSAHRVVNREAAKFPEWQEILSRLRPPRRSMRSARR